jgi:hypothetical protein
MHVQVGDLRTTYTVHRIFSSNLFTGKQDNRQTARDQARTDQRILLRTSENHWRNYLGTNHQRQRLAMLLRPCSRRVIASTTRRINVSSTIIDVHLVF